MKTIDNKQIRKFSRLCRVIVNSKIKKLPIWVRSNENEEFMNRAYYGVYKAYSLKDNRYSKKQFANFVSAKISGVLTDYITKLYRERNTHYSFTDMESNENSLACDTGCGLDSLSYDSHISKFPSNSTMSLYIAVDSALETLKSRDGKIARRYFVDKLSAQEIADEYDLHVSRVFQILSEMTEYLKIVTN